jgi:serine/threonine-protein kinase
LDHRSDIFSFGVILYEALVCEGAFTGDSAADTISAVLNQDPPDLPESVTLGMHLIVRRCLEKDPYSRLQDGNQRQFREAASPWCTPVISVLAPQVATGFGRGEWSVFASRDNRLYALLLGLITK